MENQIFRIRMTDNQTMEIYVCGTNEVKPYKETREIGITVLDSNKDIIHGGLDDGQLDSIIKFLSECRDYIKDFNAKSQPVADSLA